jgi:hypothetical protein
MIACCLNCRHCDRLLIPWCVAHEDYTELGDFCDQWQTNQKEGAK